MADDPPAAETPRSDSQATSATLMEKIQADPRNRALWEKMERRCQHVLKGWCLHRGLNKNDADDVTQQVFLRLMQRIQNAPFPYAPGGLRKYLRTMAANALTDHHNVRRRAGFDAAPDLFDDLPARDDLLDRLDKAFDLELIDAAKAEVKAALAAAGHADWWDLHAAYLVSGVKRLEFAKQQSAALGLSVDAVQKRLTRVTAQVRDAYQRLDALAGGPP